MRGSADVLRGIWAEALRPDVQGQAHRPADTGHGAAVGRECQGVTNAYLIEVRTTRKGKPTTAVLASFQTPLMDRPPNQQTTPVVATFSPGAPVKKKKVFALVLTETNGSPSVQVNAERKGCAGTLFEDDDLDNAFVKVPEGGDMVFSTVVTTS